MNFSKETPYVSVFLSETSRWFIYFLTIKSMFSVPLLSLFSFLFSCLWNVSWGLHIMYQILQVHCDPGISNIPASSSGNMVFLQWNLYLDWRLLDLCTTNAQHINCMDLTAWRMVGWNRSIHSNQYAFLLLTWTLREDRCLLVMSYFIFNAILSLSSQK